jgi:predicted molibdopterin-dependent oxidoreductase YjgC
MAYVIGDSCVSCGACVNSCPTGALTSRTPTVKNIVLPFIECETVCNGCENACKFTKRVINGKTVKMMPHDLRKSCSLGVFGYVALDNSNDDGLLPYITGDLRNFKGDKASIDSLEAIKNLLLKK